MQLEEWDGRMVIKAKPIDIAGGTRLDVGLQSIEYRLPSTKSSGRQGILFPISFTSLSERKSAFLHNLASPSGKMKYKRYGGAPIRYAGGKSLATGLIIELMPDNVERLISPFLGGGSIEVACAVELDIPVIASDIFDILITYWKGQLHEPKALYERLLKFAPTVAEFKNVKERLKAHWTGGLPLGTALDVAAYFYFNHNTSYGPHFLGWPSRVYLQPKRYQTIIERVRDFRAAKGSKGNGE